MILDRADLLAGRYRLLDRIGSGGMGVVWSAEDHLLRRQVAIKEVHPDHEDRMRREAQVGAKVCHPNVVTVYDLVYEDDKPWLVMRLVPSRSLSAVLADDGTMSPQQAAAMGRQVLAGLAAVHAQGVLHCDVKPGNVLLDERDDAHLTDFGIAADTGTRMVGTLFGAPSYIAPERARGLPMGPASDLWSLGATLYAAVEGRPPLDRGDPLATVTAIVTERPEPPTHAAELRPVIDRLLAADPADRPEVDELDRLLRRVSDGSRPAVITRPSLVPADLSSDLLDPTSADIPSPRPPDAMPTRQVPLPTPARRHARRASLALLGLSVSAAAAVFWFVGGSPADPVVTPDSPASAVNAPAAVPEAAAVSPSEGQPAGQPAAPVAQASAQAPARAPEAFSAPNTTPESSAPQVTSSEAPPVATTTEAPPTSEAPTTTVETPPSEPVTTPPNGPSEVEPLG
ncbi:serine/threonine-protein kinase [Umezawaea tangerina]|uniref:non-specific serine/threonine protein kinase n=1 Tax=Umezawaea tangerina TaxID=84725 RepID=A0A2T0SN60_9PSEU|nr:serine/threonine-protein kinase [Umezawaea tangerina]PRY34838.1 serine/threonine protein kinase [Umezawaea tangerina]